MTSLRHLTILDVPYPFADYARFMSGPQDDDHISLQRKPPRKMQQGDIAISVPHLGSATPTRVAPRGVACFLEFWVLFNGKSHQTSIPYRIPASKPLRRG